MNAYSLITTNLLKLTSVLALLASGLLAGGSFAAERVFEDSFDVNSDVDFSIDSHRGEVNISTADVDRVEITAVIRHDDRDVVEDVEIVVVRSRERVKVEVDYDEVPFRLSSLFSWDSYDYPYIEFNILLPEQAMLEVDSHRSRLDIDAPAGRVDISAHRGSGRISGVRNNLHLDTHRGDFELEVEDLHDVRIDTHRGDVDLNILQASDFAITAESHRGDLVMRGRPALTRSHDRNNYLSYNEGSGANRINVDSHRGDVTFRFVN